VKTHKPRNIPISKAIGDDLRRLIKANGEGYVFVSRPRAEKPVCRTSVVESFFKALEAVGIGEEERKRRNLTFHSWRHFFNTTLLMANVTDSKVMAVTGHVTEKMKEHYTHFDTTEFTEVTAVQERIMGQRGGKKTGNAARGAGRLGKGKPAAKRPKTSK
jgi:integrase